MLLIVNIIPICKYDYLRRKYDSVYAVGNKISNPQKISILQGSPNIGPQ